MPPPPLYASRDFGWQQRYAHFCGRVVVLSILVLLLYPFLWAWTVIGTLWFSSAKNCVCFIPVLPFSVLFVNKLLMHNAINYLQLPEVVKKWGFLIWLFFMTYDLFDHMFLLWFVDDLLSCLIFIIFFFLV